MNKEPSKKILPRVALLGRPNVGKSTLFNLFSKKQKSLVHEHPGVTRDRIVAEVEREGVPFDLIDSGGLFFGEDPLMEDIRGQTELAIEEADICLHVVDAQAGLLADDQRIAKFLRETSKPQILVVNKADTDKTINAASDFYRLGAKESVFVSATQGKVETLWTALKPLVEELSTRDVLGGDLDEAYEGEQKNINVALLGRPNAGKSSFINAAIGENRHLVSEVAGTTMDSISSRINFENHSLTFMDSAGIRRKRSISMEIEKKAVSTSLRALDDSEVALLLIDAISGLTEQDMRLAAFANEKGKASIIVVNKWDLAHKNELKAKEYAQKLKDRMPFFAYSPVLFVSAKTGKNIKQVFEKIVEIAANYHSTVPTSFVNKLLEQATRAHTPAVSHGTRIKLFFGSQVTACPPTFVFRTNRPTEIHFSYRRYLQNFFRQALQLDGVPVRIVFRGRDEQGNKKK